MERRHGNFLEICSLASGSSETVTMSAMIKLLVDVGMFKRIENGLRNRHDLKDTWDFKLREHDHINAWNNGKR